MSKIKFDFSPGFRVPGGKEPIQITEQEKLDLMTGIMTLINDHMPELNNEDCTIRFDRFPGGYRPVLMSNVRLDSSVHDKFIDMVEQGSK